MKNLNKTVLVVDDEADVRNYLKSALSNYGFEVLLASDGLEALEILKNQVPDLISLDLVMPKHSGIKFYRDLQKNKQWLKIPVLIVTGHARDELGKVDFDTMMMQGPGVYLEKPVKPENYIEKVCQLLNLDIPREIIEKKKDDEAGYRQKMLESLSKADTDSLKKAFEAIQKK
ncbi:MAG: response regulator [Bacteroidetes bacterium]|nr:MAG: response regulator [Bacteroidota bacterium]